MLSRWPDSAFFGSELIALADSRHVTPERVVRILRANHHWQGLLHWVSERRKTRAPAEGLSELEASVGSNIAVNWLDKALSKNRVRERFDTLWNSSVIDQYPAMMIVAAKRAAGGPREFDSDLNLAEWQSECELSFTESPLSVVMVPVALTYEQETEGVSGLAWLELETVAGCGSTVPHPGDIWSTILTDDPSMKEMTFLDAMKSAFRGARYLARFDKPSRGRWRIVDHNGAPLPRAAGDSAGGAALYGWYRAMIGVVDARVLVMAAVREPVDVSERWRLAPVGGIEKKARAVMDAGVGIDTIATVGEECFKELQDALKRQDTIRPVKLASDLLHRGGALDEATERS